MRKLLAVLGLYLPRPGDVVLDRFDRMLKTVEAVDPRRVHVAWFVEGRLRRGHLLRDRLVFVR